MFILPDLPYRPDALQPVISAETLRLHHGRHHRTYVDTLNSLLEVEGLAPENLEDVVREFAADPARAKLFHNAAQTWNHAFFWDSMAAAPQKPAGDLAAIINETFGGLAELKAEFVKQGVDHFASGWVWLAARAGGLKVLTTHDADDALTPQGVTPLLVCDLWEHAYYLDHQNDRKGFLEAWFDALPNWALAESQWTAARGEGRAWAYPRPLQDAGTRRRAGR